jgi:hypothetical protein
MPRPRKYATNADRQRAYRRHVTKQAEIPITIPWRVEAYAEIIRDCFARGVSIAFMARRLDTTRRAIKACLGMVPAAAPGTEVPVTKKLGRPSVWEDDKLRKHAHYMRGLARGYNWTSGFWAEDARRVDAMRSGKTVLEMAQPPRSVPVRIWKAA